MKALLSLCGFEPLEIDAEMPRVERAFQRLGITAEDIERGKERLTKYYDMELTGLRRIFRLCLRELITAILVREEGEKKVVYGFMLPGIDIIGSALMSRSKSVFTIHHSWAFHIVVGCIFDKIVPVMEAAEKKWLKAGMVAHCANVKTLVGPMTLGFFPKPDLLATAGFSCETAPKTLDLLHAIYDIPVAFMETVLDREWNEYPEPSERIAQFTAKSLRKLAGKIEEIVGFDITDDMLLAAQQAKGELLDAIGGVRTLVESSDPLPLGPAHENIFMCLSSLTLDLEGIAEAVDAVNTLHAELHQRVEAGRGVVEKGAPRVLAILPAGQTDPRLEQLACETGIAIVALDMSFVVPFTKREEDPYVTMAMGFQQHTLGMPLRGRIPLIVEGCKRLKVAGVLDRYHVGCRSVAADALLIEDAVKKALGIPVMVLEWENFDPRVYNHGEYKRRLEVFKTMMVQQSTPSV